MKRKYISILIFLIVVASGIASLFGILSKNGNGSYQFESIRGNMINIYGIGLYKDMSSDVAIQGIAQDYITLFIGIPLLLISWYFVQKGSFKFKFVLCGVLGYFLVTYMFYMAMAMYNFMFPIYIFLLGSTFFTLLSILISSGVDIIRIKNNINSEKILNISGKFLIFNSIIISLLWLGVIVPPFINGTIIPRGVEHYTTLIVQGFDLGLLLPMAFLIGILSIRKNNYGYFFTPIYMIFLSILMTALVSKIIFMGIYGANIIPAIFIIPVICISSIIFSFLLIKNIKNYEKI